MGQRGHGYPHAGNGIVLVSVDDNRYKIQIQRRQVQLYILVNLPLGERNEAVNIFIRLVDNLEKFACIAVTDILARHLLNMKIIAFLYHFGKLGKLFRRFVGHGQVVFNVVVVLFPTVLLPHVSRIIFIIVNGLHGAQSVKTHGKHAFWVEVGKTQRAHDSGHTL